MPSTIDELIFKTCIIAANSSLCEQFCGETVDFDCVL